MKVKHILLLLSILPICACTNREISEKSVQFNLDENPVSLAQSGAIKGYEVVKLETKSDAIIGNIKKVIFGDNKIFVLGDSPSQAVFIYDMEGHFINKISRRGNGENEYARLADICYDKQTNSLILLAHIPSRLFVYDTKGETLKQSLTLDRSFVKIETDGKSFMAYQGNVTQGDDKNNVCKLSKDGKIEDSWFPINEKWESVNKDDVYPLSCSVNKRIYFMEPFHRTVYSYDKAAFLPLFSLDFGTHNCPEQYVESYEEYDKNKNQDYVYDIRAFYETKNYWLFYFIYKGQAHFCVENKQTGETFYTAADKDQEKYFLPFGNFVSFDSNRFVTFIEAVNMDFYLTGKNQYNDVRDKYAEAIQRLNERVGKVSPEDNPLLLIFELN